jgi:hypothetical protein
MLFFKMFGLADPDPCSCEGLTPRECIVKQANCGPDHTADSNTDVDSNAVGLITFAVMVVAIGLLARYIKRRCCVYNPPARLAEPPLLPS